MRRAIAYLLMPIILCGCSAVKNPEKLAESVKDGYSTAAVIQTDAVIQTASKDGFTDYKVHVVYTNGENPRSEITITSPEELSGITAVCDNKSGKLSYEDITLQTALPQHRGATPMDAVPAVLDMLCTKDADCVWLESEKLILQYTDYTDEGTVTRDIAINPENGALENAKISWNGTQTISCAFSGFSINK